MYNILLLIYLCLTLSYFPYHLKILCTYIFIALYISCLYVLVFWLLLSVLYTIVDDAYLILSYLMPLSNHTPGRCEGCSWAFFKTKFTPAQTWLRALSYDIVWCFLSLNGTHISFNACIMHYASIMDLEIVNSPCRTLTHRLLVSHVCVSELGKHWFR